MSIDWAQAAKAYFDELPHPHAPSLKIREYATAVKLATAARFGGHASPHEAALFWREFAPGGVPIMPPEEFEHALDHLAPLSYTYHGRPPTMREVISLKDKMPQEVRRYFADLPHKIYPHVTAGEMVKSLQAAKPHAQEHLGRDPVLNEAAYLHHSGEHPSAYYQRIASKDKPGSTLQGDVVSPQVGRDPRDGRVPPAGRQAPGQ